MVPHHEQLRPEFHLLHVSNLLPDPGAAADGPPAAMETGQNDSLYTSAFQAEPSALTSRPVKPAPTSGLIRDAES